jgi:uncharacterized repeat protein (TIGR03803 family)
MLYGTTAQGGTAQANCGNTGCGLVFKFDPIKLRLTVLHRFTGGTDGGFPAGATSFGPTGRFLYGETNYGGAGRHGTVYRLDVTTNVLTTVHAFAGGADGAMGYGLPGVRVAKGGHVIGIATTGGLPNAADCGANRCGTIFSYTP